MRNVIALLVVAAGLAVVPAAAVAGPSIAVCAGGSPPCNAGPYDSVTGVSFQVTSGGGNRDFATVAVNCANTGYATDLTVEVPAKGTGNSQVIYPPSGSTCDATLVKQMQIGKARVLAGPVTFSVS